ncbi:MAG: Ig-like domain-containing protein [Bacteroidetes bacterium]|nr:Ig-like domain-containing protein [Bacteroidota bacterium]MCL2303096.1 Ig-like domain-containing protein [Lentimicrobiaceae bacterium]
MVQNGVCPPTYSDTVLITVDPTSVGGTISSAQTICSGSTPNPLELTGNTGAIVRWESSTDNFNLNIVTVSGSAGLSTLPLSSLTTNTYYRAVVQNGVCPSTYSDTVLITVQPTAEIDLPTGEPTTVFVCAHDLEYELPDWEQYIEYGTGVWTINGTSYLGTFDGVNTYTLGGEEIVTFTFSVYNTSTTCQNLTPVETIFFTLTVSESIYPEFDPDTDEVCSGDIKTYTLSNVNNKAYEYTWIITGDATFTVLSGGNQGGALDNYSIEISWEDAGEAIISVTIIDPNDLKCVNDNAEITITVNPLPTVSITGANTICVASTTQLSPTIDGTWVSSDETVATVDNTGLVTGVSAGSATFTFTDNVTDCSNTTLSVTVESTTVPGTISEAQTICTGGMPEPLTLSGNNGTVIEWQYSIDNFASFATIANVTTTLTSAEMGVLTTNTYYRAAVQSGVCPLAYSDTVLITVVPQPTLSTPIASNTSICEGGETTLSSTLSNGTGIPIYQWQYNNSGTWGNIANGTPAGAIYTAASNGTSTLNILGITVPDDHEYQLIAAMTGTGCNTVTSNPVIVSVIAIAVEGYITADEEFVCYDMGTTLTLNDYEGSIQWQSSTTSATAGFANILGETSATLATGGLTQTTWFRTVVTNPICGDVVSEAKEITMIPDPTVTLTSGAGTDAQTLRVGGTLTNITYITTDAVDVTVANLPPGINGVWLDDVLTISGIPSNEGVFNYTVTVTGVCETATATGTITVRQACPTQITDNINTITYNVVELMGYCWYKENVRGTKYQDGTNITPEPKTYVSSLFPDENQNADNFGLLYTYEAAFPLSTRAGDRTLCPDGWRIPTSAEWALLNTCNINDLRNPVYWLPGNNTNDLQFDARGAGYYSSASNRFEDLLGYTAWWSSDMPGATTGIAAVLHYYCSQFEILEITRADAISVRCILDD